MTSTPLTLDIFSECQRANPIDASREHQVYFDAFEQAELADELGYGCWWTVEHHGAARFSYSSVPEMILAAIAQRTSRIHIGHSGVLAPFNINHPIRVAERAAFIDVISPCVAFNNHPGSTKSYDYVREHNEAVSRIDFITPRSEITVEAAPGEVVDVRQHDGSLLRLRSLHPEYDPTDRRAAMSYMQSHQALGEVVTGLLYVDPLATDLHTATVDFARAALDLRHTSAERVAVHSRTVEALRWHEKLLEQKVRAGAETAGTLAFAKAARLEAQIELLGERIRGD